MAGQYISIKVSPEGHRRSYSLCHNPSIDHGFELLIDFAPDGVGSRYLRSLAFGDTIDLLGPLGRFTVSEAATETELVFIATGSGVAPYRSMILDLLQNKQDQRKITLLWGMRHAAELFWQDEFQQLVRSFPQFTFHPVISQAPAEWHLCRGRVTDCLIGHTFTWLQPPQLAQTGFYFCGNAAMIATTAQLLLDKGVPAGHIHTEKFN
jgi:ferredoxin-NADP reductase